MIRLKGATGRQMMVSEISATKNDISLITIFVSIYYLWQNITFTSFMGCKYGCHCNVLPILHAKFVYCNIQWSIILPNWPQPHTFPRLSQNDLVQQWTYTTSDSCTTRYRPVDIVGGGDIYTTSDSCTTRYKPADIMGVIHIPHQIVAQQGTNQLILWGGGDTMIHVNDMLWSDPSNVFM